MTTSNDAKLYELDPNGDTILILKNPNAPFAVWDKDSDASAALHINQPKLPLQLAPKSPCHSRDDEETVSPPAQLEGDVRFRLSSTRLALVSGYFKRMLNGPWKESAVNERCEYTVLAQDWDEKALLILLNIIHGRGYEVPKTIGIELLAKVALLVDYYQCHEAVRSWFLGVRRDIMEFGYYCYDRDLILRLFIAWVFHEREAFDLFTKFAIKNTRAPLQTLNLPLPQMIIDDIETARMKLLNAVNSDLNTKHQMLITGRYRCSFVCTSLLLGALTRGMHTAGFLCPREGSFYSAYSFMEFASAIRSFREPVQFEPKEEHGAHHPLDREGTYKWVQVKTPVKPCRCSLLRLFDQKLTYLESSVKGLTLGNYQQSMLFMGESDR